MTMLLITNGDSAAGNLTAAGFGDEAVILPWRDALHWGRLPDHADLARVSDVRTNVMSAMAPRRAARKVREDFAARDAHLLQHARYDTIALWFEHDLYDQLQLVQILSVLHRLGRTHGLTLVQADDYLGRQAPDAIGRFAEREVAVTGLTLTEAVLAWEAITAPTPAPVFDMVRHQSCFLPFLCEALARWLEDLPGPDGLSRSARQLLGLVAETQDTDATLGRLFGPFLEKEEAEFEGDLGFLLWAHDLALGPEPLVAGLTDPTMPDSDDAHRAVFQSHLRLTPAGEAVLAGKADHVALNGIDRWWGGTHLRDGNVWRWADGRLIAPR